MLQFWNIECIFPSSNPSVQRVQIHFACPTVTCHLFSNLSPSYCLLKILNSPLFNSKYNFKIKGKGRGNYNSFWKKLRFTTLILLYHVIDRDKKEQGLFSCCYSKRYEATQVGSTQYENHEATHSILLKFQNRRHCCSC